MHRKSRFLAMILLLLMIFMTGCGRSKDSERTAEDYYEKQSGSVDERLDNAENSDINSVYDRTMKKFENNDFEKMEGTDIFNKIFRSFYGGIYRIYLGFKAAAPVLLVLGRGIDGKVLYGKQAVAAVWNKPGVFYDCHSCRDCVWRRIYK